MKKFSVLFISLFLSLASINNAFAQDNADSVLQESMRDIITVGALGGVGAVIGLSTLSFAEEPSKKLKNIVVGASIGIILGVGVVAWQQATKSQESYQEAASLVPSYDFNTNERVVWHQAKHEEKNSKNLEMVGYSFSF